MAANRKPSILKQVLPEFASLALTGNAEILPNYMFLWQSMNSAHFRYEDNKMIYIKKSPKGKIDVPVCNFWAYIVQDLSYMKDDKPSYHSLVIAGWSFKTKKSLPQVTIKATELKNADWVAANWGADAHVFNGGKAHLADMIHAASLEIKRKKIYSRTGWLKDEASRNFLHAGGSLFDSNIDVDLIPVAMNSTLQKYRLPDSPAKLTDVAPTVLSLFDVSKEHLSYPLLSAALLAPLGECMRENETPIDFTLFLVGRSESGKSYLAALHQSFFGEFDKKSFPANFTDTANSIEPKLDALQDVLMVVDDDFPDENQRKTQMQAVVQKIVRAISDGNTRSRMGRKTFVPRTLPICTGEYIPKLPPSTLNRILFLTMEQTDLDYYGAFKHAWENRDHLRHFIVHYLRWIAANWDLVKELLKENICEAENLLSDQTSGRSRDAAVKLPAGLAVGLRFLLDNQIISEELYHHHIGKARTVLAAASVGLVNQNRAPSIAETFLESVSSLHQAASHVIIPIANEACPNNWIGCYDDNYAYLLPSKVFSAVKKHCNDQKIAFPNTAKEVWTDLANNEIISYDQSRKRFSRQKKLPCRNNLNVDVIVIDRDRFEGL